MVHGSNGVEVVRLKKSNKDSSLKAFADISLAKMFVIKGFKVFEGEKGLFVGMPSRIGKDGKWYNTAYPLTKEFKEVLCEVVLQAYESE